MIQSFKHKGLRQLFEKGAAKGIRADHVAKVENILAVLNRAEAFRYALARLWAAPAKGQSQGFLERHSESQLADHFSLQRRRSVRRGSARLSLKGD